MAVFRPQSLFIRDCSSYEYCRDGFSPLQLDIFPPSSQDIDQTYYPKILSLAQPRMGYIKSWRDDIPIPILEGVHFRRWSCRGLVDEDDDEMCLLLEASPLDFYPNDAIQVDGRPVEDLVDCSNPPRQYKSLCKDLWSDVSYFALNSNCKSKLKKRRAWISISVVVVFLLLLVGGIYMYRKRTTTTSSSSPSVAADGDDDLSDA